MSQDWKVAPKLWLSDLVFPLTLEAKINLFDRRIYGWQLDIADEIANGENALPDGSYAVLQILFSYFETIAKYQDGYVNKYHSKKYFKKGVRSVYSKINDIEITKPQVVNNLLNLLYEGIRCGLYHSSITGPRIKLTIHIQGSIEIKDEKLYIDPHKFVKDLKHHFSNYIQDLKDENNVQLRTNFEKRFDYDTKA